MGGAGAPLRRALRGGYHAVGDLAERRAERRAGVVTTGTIALAELGVDGEHRVRYKPSGWRTLRRILPPGSVGRDDVLIDFGCGMGRVVYQAAAQYDLRRVIGVELSADLAAHARDNLERNRARLRCADVSIVVADVLDYAIPDDVTIAYFYNPFTGPVFQAVVDGLVASARRAPRRLRVVYANPIEERMLLAAGFVRTGRLRGWRPGAEWSRSNATHAYELRV
jgi:hypothetical protein